MAIDYANGVLCSEPSRGSPFTAAHQAHLLPPVTFRPRFPPPPSSLRPQLPPRWAQRHRASGLRICSRRPGEFLGSPSEDRAHSPPPPLPLRPAKVPRSEGEQTAGPRKRATRGPPRPQPGPALGQARSLGGGRVPCGPRAGAGEARRDSPPGPRLWRRRTCRRRERRRRPRRGGGTRRRWNGAERSGAARGGPPARAAAAPAGDPDLARLLSGGGRSLVLFIIDVCDCAFLSLGGRRSGRRQRLAWSL